MDKATDTASFYSTLLDYRVNPNDYSTLKANIIQSVQSIIGESTVTDVVMPNGKLSLIIGANDQITLRFFDEGSITIDHFGVSKESHPNGKKLKQSLTEQIQSKLAPIMKSNTSEISKSKLWPPLLRLGKFDPFIPTTDNLLIEYDFVETLHEENSKFQNIKVMKSLSYGPMLILDDDPNMSEKDIIYTKTILGNGEVKISGKNILVLGGGDGGILHEILNENPNFVTMLELDEAVLNVARKHLRGVCGDSLDSYEGKNYKIILGNCVVQLEKFVAEGTQFDFIINDLTAFPISGPVGESNQDEWDFIRLILEFCMKVLHKDGVYITQGNGQGNVLDILKFEEFLKRYTTISWQRIENICVPSYHEQWVFYKINKL